MIGRHVMTMSFCKCIIYDLNLTGNFIPSENFSNACMKYIKGHSLVASQSTLNFIANENGLVPQVVN